MKKEMKTAGGGGRRNAKRGDDAEDDSIVTDSHLHCDDSLTVLQLEFTMVRGGGGRGRGAGGAEETQNHGENKRERKASLNGRKRDSLNRRARGMEIGKEKLGNSRLISSCKTFHFSEKNEQRFKNYYYRRRNSYKKCYLRWKKTRLACSAQNKNKSNKCTTMSIGYMLRTRDVSSSS